ncbi:MAG: type IX secretion system membrane protein PorP/SprF [Bacteroidales bacterium]|jgi:hypothetical protein
MKFFTNIIIDILFLFCFKYTYADNDHPYVNDTTLKTASNLVVSIFNNHTTNPALTGFDNSPSLHITGACENPFMTLGNFYFPHYYEGLFEIPVGKRSNDAFGINYTDERGGSIITYSPDISYAHNFNLHFSNDSSFYHKLRVGISFARYKRIWNYSKSSWPDQIDATYGFVFPTGEGEPSDTILKFSNVKMGIWYNNPLVYCGVSVLNYFSYKSYTDSSGYIKRLKQPAVFNISCGGNIRLNNTFRVYPSWNMLIVTGGFKGRLNSYEPAVLMGIGKNYLIGLSYMDLNKFTIRAAVTLFKHISIAAACGFSTNPDLDEFKQPAYLGGDIKVIFGKYKSN